MALNLPVLSRLDMAAANTLSSAAASLSFETGPIRRLDVVLDACLGAHDVAEEIALTLDDQPVGLRLEKSVLSPVLGRSGHQDEGDALLKDPELAGIVLEHLLSPALQRVEADYKAAVRIDRVNRTSQDSRAILCVRFQLGADLWDAPCSGELVAYTEQSAELLRRLLAPTVIVSRQMPLHLPAIGRVLSPTFELGARDLSALRPGDGLLLDPDFTLDGPLILGFSDHQGARVEWTEDCLDVTGFVNPATSQTEERRRMASPDDTSITIDDIPVTLSLELDRIEIPFADLGNLRVGSVVPFRSERPHTVRVLANGRSFANADLVQIEDRLAVRITSLAGRTE